MTDDANRLMVQQIPHLRRYARALTGGIDSADDLVQDCLERAWSRIHRWRPGSDMRFWLFTIKHNVNANRVRAESRRPTVVAFEDGRDGRGIGPAQEHRAAVGNLADALAALPEDQRAAVLLIGLEGLSYGAAAEVLAIPQGTLMSRLSRGRAALRELTAGGLRPPLKRVK
mgnify:FL=1|jgi:RNA polymerase sigma-70 factor (ECF subfamily)